MERYDPPTPLCGVALPNEDQPKLRKSRDSLMKMVENQEKANGLKRIWSQLGRDETVSVKQCEDEGMKR